MRGQKEQRGQKPAEAAENPGRIEIDCKEFHHVIDRRVMGYDDRRNPVLNQVCVCREADHSASGFNGKPAAIVTNELEAQAWAV